MALKRLQLVFRLFFVIGLASVLIFKFGDRVRSSFAMYCTQIVLACEHAYVDPVRAYRQRREEKERIEELMCYYRQAYQNVLSRYVERSGTRIDSLQVLSDTDYIKRYKTDYMVHAQVISRTMSSQEHIFYIDVGSHRGATDQMSVVYQNCLVGRIIEVFPFYSVVMLITDPRSKVAAYDEVTNASGMIQGMGLEHKLTYAFVSHLDTVNSSDLIFSSGEGIVYPRGFLLGRVVNLFGTDGLFHRIDVEPVIDFATIPHCYVLQKGAEYCSSPENALHDNPEQGRSEQGYSTQGVLEQSVSEKSCSKEGCSKQCCLEGKSVAQSREKPIEKLSLEKPPLEKLPPTKKQSVPRVIEKASGSPIQVTENQDAIVKKPQETVVPSLPLVDDTKKSGDIVQPSSAGQLVEIKQSMSAE